jgi:PEP-CTERM motif
MKIWKLVLAVSLVATWGLMSAAGAKADGVPDPNITIGKTASPGGDPPDGATDTDPLVITDDSGSTTFTYTGPDTAEFFVEIIPFAGENLATFESEIFTCTPGAGAVSCGSAPVCTEFEAGGPFPDCPANGPAQEFVFVGPTDENGNLVPFIFTGDTLIVTTPEPSAIVLLVIGLASLVGFGWRRRITNPS